MGAHQEGDEVHLASGIQPQDPHPNQHCLHSVGTFSPVGLAGAQGGRRKQDPVPVCWQETGVLGVSSVSYTEVRDGDLTQRLQCPGLIPATHTRDPDRPSPTSVSSVPVSLFVSAPSPCHPKCENPKFQTT